MAIESKMSRSNSPRPFGVFEDDKKPESKNHVWIWILMTVSIVGIGGFFAFKKMNSKDVFSEISQVSNLNISTESYQAVFLDNGQTYFGKLENQNRDFLIIKDVYYLQAGVGDSQNANLALQKLGLEAHGPEDEMQINKEHILFIENMKSDSKVMQAINQHKSR